MQIVKHIGPRQIELAEVPDFEPGPGEAVVAMRASGLCGSDLHVYRRKPQPEPNLNILGHEPSGVVTAVGHGVKHLQIGQRVTVYHYISCGHCRMCRQGNWMWCPQAQAIGGRIAGAHADAVKVPARNCLPLPDKLSFIDGAFIACGAGTTWSALGKIRPRAGETAVVFGLGPIGLLGVALLKGFGARVAAVGRRASRLELARKLGAERVVDIDREDKPAEVILGAFPCGVEMGYETSGAPAAQQQMLRALARFGRAAVVGSGNHEPAINLNTVSGKQLTLAGSFVMNIGEYENLTRFIIERQLRLDRLVTHRFSLEKAEEAYELADKGDCGKVIFEWPDSD